MSFWRALGLWQKCALVGTFVIQVLITVQILIYAHSLFKVAVFLLLINTVFPALLVLIALRRRVPGWLGPILLMPLIAFLLSGISVTLSGELWSHAPFSTSLLFAVLALIAGVGLARWLLPYRIVRFVPVAFMLMVAAAWFRTELVMERSSRGADAGQAVLRLPEARVPSERGRAAVSPRSSASGRPSLPDRKAITQRARLLGIPPEGLQGWGVDPLGNPINSPLGIHIPESVRRKAKGGQPCRYLDFFAAHERIKGDIRTALARRRGVEPSAIPVFYVRSIHFVPVKQTGRSRQTYIEVRDGEFVVARRRFRWLGRKKLRFRAVYERKNPDRCWGPPKEMRIIDTAPGYISGRYLPCVTPVTPGLRRLCYSNVLKRGFASGKETDPNDSSSH